MSQNLLEDCSIIDLVIRDEPDMIDDVKVLGHFSSSDHNALYWTTNVAVKKVSTEQINPRL